MKKWSKKMIAIMLVMVMALSMIACGKEAADPVVSDGNVATSTPSEGETDDATEAPTEVPTEEATPEPVVDKYDAFDLGERTITVGLWWDYFYTSEHTSVDDDPKVANAETAQMRLDNVRRIEEKYNCKIVFKNLGWEGIMTSINTSIAAGTPECDIYLTDLQFGIPAVLEGLATDLEKVALENNDLFGDQSIVKPMQELGGTYLFSEQAPNATGIFLGYNYTMIEDLGLEDPQELFHKGEWTWEKFAELAKAAIKDNDGDGVTDVYGYGGSFIDFTNGLIMNNGGHMASGTVEGVSSPQTVEAFEFIHRLYNKDQSARPWNGDDWDDNLFAWVDGKVMFWTAQVWSLEAKSREAIEAGAELPFEYRAVPYPAGPSSDGTYYTPFAGNWYMIPVGVEEPGKVLQVFEEFLNWHGGDPEYRDDIEWLEGAFQREEDVEIAIYAGQNTKLDIWNMMGDYFNYGNLIWWPIVVNKDTTVAQAVEATKTVMQDCLDILLGE